MNEPKKPSLSVVFKELLEKLWKGNPKVPYSLDNFKKISVKLINLFENNKNEENFYFYLIKQLHYKLNNIDNFLNYTFQDIIQQDIQVDPYEQKHIYQEFMSDFRLNNNSIITKYFNGINKKCSNAWYVHMNNKNKGINAPLIKYNYENYFYLEFQLEEVIKYVMKNNNNNKEINFLYNYEVSIYDCFNHYQKPNENEGYCEKCLSNNDKIFSVKKMFSLPKILMIAFNRSKNLGFIKINFEMQLNLSKIILNNNQIYKLQSVIKYFGDKNYFIPYCRFIDNHWYYFNDYKIYETDKIHNEGVTYILFYKSKN